jgi:hypothetical protein
MKLVPIELTVASTSTGEKRDVIATIDADSVNFVTYVYDEELDQEFSMIYFSRSPLCLPSSTSYQEVTAHLDPSKFREITIYDDYGKKPGYIKMTDIIAFHPSEYEYKDKQVQGTNIFMSDDDTSFFTPLTPAQLTERILAKI